MKDKDDRKDFLFHLLADQNNDLLEEVKNMKESMKAIVGQMIDDFEDGIKELKEETRKQNTETMKTLENLQNKMEKMYKAKKIHPTSTQKSSTARASTSSNPSSNPSSKPSSTKPSKTASEKSSKTKDTVNKTKKPSNVKPVKKPRSEHQNKTGYQKKQRVLFVGDSLVHNTNFNMLEVVTNTTIKTAKAYSSAWDNHARFKEQNIMDVAKTELKKSSFNQLVI